MEFLTWKFQLTIYVVAINAAVFYAFFAVYIYTWPAKLKIITAFTLGVIARG